MKKTLLLVFIVIFTTSLQAQKDTVNYTTYTAKKNIQVDAANVSISIYPVPVKDNSFTIRSEKEVASVKITNIIGQDIFKAKYNNPQTITKIVLDNPQRGMYLVTIIFNDDVRVVKKIMIEQSE